jgi:CDP-diacylglycerol--glycerol-3-phosphate 3-phosphatidyltransferase
MANVISPIPEERSNAVTEGAQPRPTGMNLPNQLTVARFFLTVLFVVAMSSNLPFAHSAGLLLFVLAGVTDYLDGEIARRRNLETDFGKLMDPLADKIMMAAAFICLIPLGAFPPWVAIVIISREFLITGLRLLAASKGTVLPAEKLGKHKTVWQIVTVIYFLVLLAAAEFVSREAPALANAWALLWKLGSIALVAVTLVLTIYSGLGYLWKNRGLISTA